MISALDTTKFVDTERTLADGEPRPACDTKALHSHIHLKGATGRKGLWPLCQWPEKRCPAADGEASTPPI